MASAKFATQILSASDLDQQIKAAKKRAEAHDVVQSAKDQVAELDKKAEEAAKRQRALMQSAAKREISKELAATKKLAASLAAKEILDSAARVQRKFDELTPWIEDLVEKSVRQIVGELPDEALFRKIVTRAINTSRKGLQYELRTGNEMYDAATALVAELEGTEYRGLILSVERDSSLSEDTVILASSDGALDITLETQLKALRAELTSVLQGA